MDLQSRRISELPGSKNFFSPRWSFDGRIIVASNQMSHTLMVFDVARQVWRECCQLKPSDGALSLSRDGNYVYANTSETASFIRYRLAGGKVEQVAKIDVPGGMKGDDFSYWGGLTPDGSPMVMRDASTQEIYALDVDFP